MPSPYRLGDDKSAYSPSPCSPACNDPLAIALWSALFNHLWLPRRRLDGRRLHVWPQRLASGSKEENILVPTNITYNFLSEAATESYAPYVKSLNCFDMGSHTSHLPLEATHVSTGQGSVAKLKALSTTTRSMMIGSIWEACPFGVSRN